MTGRLSGNPLALPDRPDRVTGPAMAAPTGTARRVLVVLIGSELRGGQVMTLDSPVVGYPRLAPCAGTRPRRSCVS